MANKQAAWGIDIGQAGLKAIRLQYAEAADQVTAVSSTRGTGLSSVARVIREWTGFELQRPDGGPL